MRKETDAAIHELLQHIHQQYDGTDAPVLLLALDVEAELTKEEPAA